MTDGLSHEGIISLHSQHPPALSPPPPNLPLQTSPTPPPLTHPSGVSNLVCFSYHAFPHNKRWAFACFYDFPTHERLSFVRALALNCYCSQYFQNSRVTDDLSAAALLKYSFVTKSPPWPAGGTLLSPFYPLNYCNCFLPSTKASCYICCVSLSHLIQWAIVTSSSVRGWHGGKPFSLWRGIYDLFSSSKQAVVEYYCRRRAGIECINGESFSPPGWRN